MDPDYLRYSCQIALPGFTEATQNLIRDAKVLIVGAGGLGCPSAQYLTSSGIGTIGIADFDTISIGNLHRQILFNPDEIGLNKAIIACRKLKQQNPQVNLIPLDFKISSQNVMDIIAGYDIIVDGTDNFETKYLLNDACVLSKKPLVHGAIYQYEGQVAVWNFKNKDGTFSPNFRDIFPDVDASTVPNCAEGGVIPTLAGIIGCMQANEVIKYFSKSNGLLAGKLLIFNAVNMETRIINIGNISNTSITVLAESINIPMLTVHELRERIAKHSVKLIDVRSIRERELFNIGGTHLPVQDINYDHFPIDSNLPLVLYCASGKRSGDVVKKLKTIYSHLEIYSLQGGIKEWIETLN